MSNAMKQQVVEDILMAHRGKWVSHRAIWAMSVRLGFTVHTPHVYTTALLHQGVCEKKQINGLMCARIN